MMWRYYELLSDKPAAQITAMHTAAQKDEENPKVFKQTLAHEFTVRFHGAAAAEHAVKHFESQIVRGEIPTDMPTVVVKTDDAGLSPPLFYLLKTAGLATGSSVAKRLITQGAVKVDGKKAAPDDKLQKGNKAVVQVGKRRFVRLVAE